MPPTHWIRKLSLQLHFSDTNPFSLPSTAETPASVSSSAQCRAFLRIESPHLKAMGVVNQAVEDAGGGGGITDLLVPAHDR